MTRAGQGSRVHEFVESRTELEPVPRCVWRASRRMLCSATAVARFVEGWPSSNVWLPAFAPASTQGATPASGRRSMVDAGLEAKVSSEVALEEFNDAANKFDRVVTKTCTTTQIAKRPHTLTILAATPICDTSPYGHRAPFTTAPQSAPHSAPTARNNTA